ncbi:unnamed protein product [Macrosiphum euphorbiae]|uniref:Uncharacterized protein n=1 Tax=Macrosiphum euphorbiae TaxID=13131 RepID=A0AAV0W2N0_9HEMI|nr:unnamed protein product [Macrosiphum euphorbiae]
MVDERSSLTKVAGKTKGVFRNAKYGSTNDQKQVIDTKQKYRKLNEDDMYYNYEADLMLDSVNHRYKKIVFTTYAMGMAMTIIGCLLVL